MTDEGDLIMTGITPWNPPAFVDSSLAEGSSRPLFADVVAVAPLIMLEIAVAFVVVVEEEEERKGFGEEVLSDWRSSRRSGCQGSFSRRLMIAMSSSSSSKALVEAERRVDRF